MKPPRPQTQVPVFKPKIDMKPIFVLVAFYVFVLLLLAGTCYLVFFKNVTDKLFFVSFIVMILTKPKVTNFLTYKSDE